MDQDLFVARHGETEWNRDRRMQGRGDAPLTERGRAQARQLAAFAKGHHVRRVIASPLGRARLTAGLIAEAAGASLAFDDDLMEVDFGEAGGLRQEDIDARWPDLMARREADKWHERWPGGESYADLEARVRGFLARTELGADTLLLAHETLNRVMLVSLGAATPDEVLASKQPADVVLRVRPLEHLDLRAEPRWRPGLFDPLASITPARRAEATPR